jgi:hypothetical protein
MNPARSLSAGEALREANALPSRRCRTSAGPFNFPVPEIPGNPYRGSDAPDRAYAHLRDYHGVPPGTASDRLHRIKQRSGLSPIASVAIGRTGDVYDEMTGEHLGSLTDPAA